jgi:hypothetical protein
VAQKISPVNFLASFFLMALGRGNKSLKRWAEKLSFLIGESVSAVALQKKVNESQIRFLRKVLEKSIKNKTDYFQARATDALKSFKHILIQDSTSLSLNDKLKDQYPGSSNQSVKNIPIMKIHVVFDLLRNSFKEFSLTSFRETDYAHSCEILDYANKGDLVLRDQGYFLTDMMREMTERGIYFISSFRRPVKLYDGQKEVNLLRLLRRQDILDKTLCITNQYRLPLRVLAIRLDSQTVERRKRNTVDKRYVHSKEYRKLLEYAIFVTNLQASQLNLKLIIEIYRLRWRIEIIFKSWKSCIHIKDVVSMTNNLRVQSYVYCMLICIVLLMTDFARMVFENPSISLMKFTGFLVNNLEKILEMWLKNKAYNGHIKKMVNYFCQYDRRSDRKNFSSFLLELG